MTIAMNNLALAATGDPWQDAFFGIEPDERFALIVLAIIFSTAVIISLAGIMAVVLNAMHRRRVEEGLKRDMLDRGLSADEIVKVIEAAPLPEHAAGRWAASSCKNK